MQVECSSTLVPNYSHASWKKKKWEGLHFFVTVIYVYLVLTHGMIERMFRDSLFQCGRVLPPASALQPQLALGTTCRQLDGHASLGTGSSANRLPGFSWGTSRAINQQSGVYVVVNVRHIIGGG